MARTRAASSSPLNCRPLLIPPRIIGSLATLVGGPTIRGIPCLCRASKGKRQGARRRGRHPEPARRRRERSCAWINFFFRPFVLLGLFGAVVFGLVFGRLWFVVRSHHCALLGLWCCATGP